MIALAPSGRCRAGDEVRRLLARRPAFQVIAIPAMASGRILGSGFAIARAVPSFRAAPASVVAGFSKSLNPALEAQASGAPRGTRSGVFAC